MVQTLTGVCIEAMVSGGVVNLETVVQRWPLLLPTATPVSQRPSGAAVDGVSFISPCPWSSAPSQSEVTQHQSSFLHVHAVEMEPGCMPRMRGLPLARAIVQVKHFRLDRCLSSSCLAHSVRRCLPLVPQLLLYDQPVFKEILKCV